MATSLYRRWWQASLAASLTVTAVVFASSPAQADELADTYTRSQVREAALFISEHGGRTGALASLLGIGGSLGCGPVAPVCGGLVGFWFSTYGFYTDAVTTASKDNACLYVYAGDTTSGSDGGGLPYVHEVNDDTCHD